MLYFGRVAKALQAEHLAAEDFIGRVTRYYFFVCFFWRVDLLDHLSNMHKDTVSIVLDIIYTD